MNKQTNKHNNIETPNINIQIPVYDSIIPLKKISFPITKLAIKYNFLKGTILEKKNRIGLNQEH